MTEHGDQLRTAFETHEHLAPDAAAVYSRVQELSRSYQRRRWGVQAAGGAVLGVSLIAGAISLPGLLSGQQQESVSVGAAATPSVTPSASAPSADEQQKLWDAYFQAGYDYDDAVKLAGLWKSKDEIGLIKAEAGRRLLAGETLPFKPTPNQDEVTDPKVEAQLNAFSSAGYNYEDAEKLATLWKTATPYAAKIEGGKRLLAKEQLPIKPSNPEQGKEEARVNAYFNAGYTYDDAVRLASLWKKADPYAAKVEAGKRILAGDAMPFKP
ncbi:hypothetical protein DMB66_43565 [Actinoplanes sp. ATCC 53533]|uniref:hypothetical protein n=1 Tax=Actinoplanes sp. ATCC 53533 TaxID=1288362 RepID=UPI000F79A60B|nr:hypothetical protein [Actinoplanes sp. ATCC 53533]RSM50476.1 hypothetical protein DMB66_43565 [Actinoplanes sp. ATCC 53533]